jgi:hypothetical protein
MVQRAFKAQDVDRLCYFPLFWETRFEQDSIE